jgi:hypothetical protein
MNESIREMLFDVNAVPSFEALLSLDADLDMLRREHNTLAALARLTARRNDKVLYKKLSADLRGVERLARDLRARRKFVADSLASRASKLFVPPLLGERLLLLILAKEERANIPGDLEEEFKEIALKHGARYAKLWYYKQVAASAWPMLRKAVGWGLLASIINLGRRLG